MHIFVLFAGSLHKKPNKKCVDEKGHFLVGILVLNGECNVVLCREDSSRSMEGENWLVHTMLLKLVKSG